MPYELVRAGDNPGVVSDAKTISGQTAYVQGNQLLESKDGVLNPLDKDMGTVYLTDEAGFLPYGWRLDTPAAQAVAGRRHPFSIGAYGGVYVQEATPDVIPTSQQRSAAGTTTLVASGGGSTRIYILHMLVIAAPGTVELSFIEGTSTVVWGPLDVGRGFESSGTMRNPVWRTLSTAVDFRFSTNASVRVTVKVNYAYA